jgi:putative endonuclease
MPLTNRKPLGSMGEDVACDLLQRAGYRILERNYRCPLGEIDLIARVNQILVFAEVKSAEGLTRVLPKSRVDRRKQRKLRQVAQYYLKEKRLHTVSARFDVVQVRFEDGKPRAVEVIPNAFEIET